MSNNAKILFLDLETQAMKADIWHAKPNFVPWKMVSDSGRIIMCCAKWKGSPETMLMDEYSHTEDEFVAKMWELIDEADILVGHNLVNFDLRWMNTAIIDRGMVPPSPVATVDTLKIVKRHFRLPYYNLDYLCQRWGLGGKVKHEGIGLWQGWELGDESAIKKMRRYCRQDVGLLAKLYRKTLPWVDNHPNVGLFTDMARPVCTNCGSHKLVNKGAGGGKGVGMYTRLKCDSCGTNLRGVENLIPADKRKKMPRVEKLR